MESNANILKIGIGTKESKGKKLEAKKVTIMEVEVQEVGENNNKKLVCRVKHPDSEELISISSIKWETKGKLDITGLWVNLDSDGNLQKGSSLAHFLEFNNASCIEELLRRDLVTLEDNKGYLVFKCY